MNAASSRVFALAVVTLAGCSSSAPKDFAFTSTSPVGVVVMGIAPERPNLTMHVAAVDPQTCRLLPGPSRKYSIGGLPFRPSTRRFVVDDVRPGHYVITSVAESGGTVNFSQTFEQETSAFHVVAGRISYIGDFRLTSIGPELAGHDDAAVRRHLSTFPGISGTPVRTPLIRTSFAYQGKGPRIAGCALPGVAASQR